LFFSSFWFLQNFPRKSEIQKRAEKHCFAQQIKEGKKGEKALSEIQEIFFVNFDLFLELPPELPTKCMAENKTNCGLMI
jgi:hypothetical protein